MRSILFLIQLLGVRTELTFCVVDSMAELVETSPEGYQILVHVLCFLNYKVPDTSSFVYLLHC